MNEQTIDVTIDAKPDDMVDRAAGSAPLMSAARSVTAALRQQRGRLSLATAVRRELRAVAQGAGDRARSRLGQPAAERAVARPAGQRPQPAEALADTEPDFQDRG